MLLTACRDLGSGVATAKEDNVAAEGDVAEEGGDAGEGDAAGEGVAAGGGGGTGESDVAKACGDTCPRCDEKCNVR